MSYKDPGPVKPYANTRTGEVLLPTTWALAAWLIKTSYRDGNSEQLQQQALALAEMVLEATGDRDTTVHVPAPSQPLEALPELPELPELPMRGHEPWCQGCQPCPECGGDCQTCSCDSSVPPPKLENIDG